jgi:hypothetical protein
MPPSASRCNNSQSSRTKAPSTTHTRRRQQGISTWPRSQGRTRTVSHGKSATASDCTSTAAAALSTRGTDGARPLCPGTAGGTPTFGGLR